jgi:hypothetical protein
MATLPAIDVVVFASSAVEVVVALAIITIQAVVIAHERVAGVVGTVAAAGVPVGTAAGATATAYPHPSVGPPFIAAGTCAPVGLIAGAAGSLAATAAVGAPASTTAGTAAAHPPTCLLFLAVDASSPAGPTADIVGPLDAVIAVDAPTGTVAGVAGP